jgi:dihydrofolate reductase
MKLSLIVAMGKHREIGKDNDLLWHLPKDMRFFKETTLGHSVVMGRKNWDSIPDRFRPLANRENIVLTRNDDFEAEGATVIHDFKDLPDVVETSDEKKCFIIGGAQVYDIALKSGQINEMYVTEVEETFEADTFFPFVDSSGWEVEVVLEHTADDKNPHSFRVKRFWR